MAKGVANHACHQTKRVELLGPLGWPRERKPGVFKPLMWCQSMGPGKARLSSLLPRNSLKEMKSQIPTRTALLSWWREDIWVPEGIEEYKKQLPRRSTLPWSAWQVSFQSTKHMLKVDSQAFSSEVCIFDNFSMFLNNVYFLVMDCFYSNSNFRELYFSKSQNPK